MELRRGVHRDQVVNEYWLTEAQALKVIAKSDTAIADTILDEVIGVFIAVRRGMLAAPQQVPVLSTSPVFVRRQFRVPGIYQRPVVLYPMARDLLEALALGRLLLPGATVRRLTAAASAQGVL